MVQQTREVTRSERYFEEAQRVLPGGVTAAARLHRGTGRPFIAARGKGSRIWDVDGNEYIDFCTSFGASLLGHGHPDVTAAVEEGLARGILCSFELEEQGEAARRLTEMVPCAELVRFTTSGTETTWHAIRTARMYTGREVVVKFEGHFHGYHDYLGFSTWPDPERAGPADQPATIPESGGIPGGLQGYVAVLPFNDPEVLERTLRARAHEIAAVILEPINFNSGGILPTPEFLQALRSLTRELGIVLIFDEILSGFRTGPDCAQGYLDVTPDLCTLGKAIGGGLALSAFAGSREVMGAVSPLGGAVHSGTFNAHPLPILAANAFLKLAKEASFWEHFQQLQERLYPGLRDIFARTGLPVQVQAIGNRFCLNYGLEEEPRSYRDAMKYDRDLAARFAVVAQEEGVYFHTLWHSGLSAMHTMDDVDEALERIERAARRVAAGRS
ncbi:MAG TPA: aspartate aminotransferase family protein [Chloroflexota bacterium]|nr:aspartate aminotransferase family protein [Chloroflexota bacterium]